MFELSEIKPSSDHETVKANSSSKTRGMNMKRVPEDHNHKASLLLHSIITTVITITDHDVGKFRL
jgi:hypothetical protein